MSTYCHLCARGRRHHAAGAGSRLHNTSVVPLSIPVKARRRVGRWLRERSIGFWILALVVGAGAGLGAIVFRWLISVVTKFFTGEYDYAGGEGAPHPWLPGLGPWFLLFVPVLAGLVYGPLVQRFAPEARGPGVSEVMYSIAERSGRIPSRVMVVKALASALCIGGGGSVGREGPVVQIGSAMGSTLGRFTGLSETRLRVLIACGAAGGIAATFNAPLAGPFFAMELILRSFAVQSFGAVVLASLTASIIGRAALGNEAFLELPAFELRSQWEYLLFIGLGLLLGCIGVLFNKLVYLVENLCDWAWRGPEWLRPAAGGLLLGGILVALPQMYGVGYPVMEGAVQGEYVLWFLLVLLVGKLGATSLTIGIGGSGGVFAPSLFIGATAGTAFGLAVHTWLPELTASPGVYGLLGMGAAFAGAARAPITAVIVLVELTSEYSLILPLMTAIVVATLISRAISRDTIYTSKLRRRGVDLDTPQQPGRLAGRHVRDIVEPLPAPLDEDTDLAAAGHALALSGNGILPVVGNDGTYHGCVTARAVAEVLADEQSNTLRVAELAELPPLVTEDSTLTDALAALAASEATGLPVLAADHTLSGWITHRTILRAVRPAETR